MNVPLEVKVWFWAKEISTAEDIERIKMENAELAKVKAELAQYQTTYPSDEYEYFQDTNKKYGFKNKAGEVVIEPQFKDIITYFSSDRAFVKNKEGKIVAIDGNGYFRGTSLEDPAIWHLVRIQDITRIINVLDKED